MANFKVVRAYHGIASGGGTVSDSFAVPSGYYVTGMGFAYNPDSFEHRAHVNMLASCSGWGAEGTGVQYSILCEGSGPLEIYAFCVDGITDETDSGDWIGY